MLRESLTKVIARLRHDLSFAVAVIAPGNWTSGD
jgi:hypothetical protein